MFPKKKIDKPWDGYMTPFRLIGNVYFVGTFQASSHLIDTGDGLVLIDTGYANTFYLVIDGIHRLVHLDLIAGLPFEDYASFARSFDEAYFCADVLQLGFLKLLHGTVLRERAVEYGIVCTAAAPYTVLKTNWLTFEELHRLHGIADLLDRLQEKGRFTHGLYYILSQTNAPFAFFEGFLDYLKSADGRALQQIAQRDLFTLFYSYGKTLLSPALHAELATYMEADFKSAEVRKPPKFQ